jgi:alpha-N-acetylglucosamine transferase
MTEYSKVLYIDPDILPIRPLSAVFETPFAKDMYDSEYLFAAVYDSEQVRDGGKFTRPVPKLGPDDISAGENFNAGMFLIRPSEQHWLYVSSIYQDPRKTDYLTDMKEQSLLRYAFRKDGPYPWTRLSQMYHTQFPRLSDLDKSFAIHGQFWKDNAPVNGDLRRFWYFAWGEMKGYYVHEKINRT